MKRGGERAHTRQTDCEADLCHVSVRVAEERRGPLESPSQQVLVRCDAEGPVELPAEMRSGQAGGASEIGHRERVEVAAVSEVFRSQQVANRGNHLRKVSQLVPSRFHRHRSGN